MIKKNIINVVTSNRYWRFGIYHVLELTIWLALASAFIVPTPVARILVMISLLLLTVHCIIGIILTRLARSKVLQQTDLAKEAQDSRFQVQELFAMTDMLQAAEDHQDAGAILEATATRLLPDFGGALYVFNNSRDRLDLAKSWAMPEGLRPAETLSPNSCWALKRGKPHINHSAEGTLTCSHHLGEMATVEVPMMARGQIHGLLLVTTREELSGFERLMEIRRTTRALADSMSLAISNIALREKLRTQSLRDPLTGLYNRRYMEDALDRYVNLADRSGNATSVVMIDLDNFKRLNDENGHAKGDAILRDVAGQLVAAVRPSDVVARYGGEELVVIMPNCNLKDAAVRAEILRSRVEALSDPHGCKITASFGVASVPETATGALDVVPMADAALYVAKQKGKNRVECADARGRVKSDERKAKSQPRLAVG